MTTKHFSLVLKSLFVFMQSQLILGDDVRPSSTVKASDTTTDSLTNAKHYLDIAIYPVCIVTTLCCIAVIIDRCLVSKGKRGCFPCFFSREEPHSKITSGEGWSNLCKRVEKISTTVKELLILDGITCEHKNKLTEIDKWAKEFDLPRCYEDKIGLEILENAHITDDGHSYHKDDLLELKNRGYPTPQNNDLAINNIIENKNLNAAKTHFLEQTEKLIKSYEVEVAVLKRIYKPAEEAPYTESTRLLEV